MPAVTAASQQPAIAAETDPQALGWMQGFPPPRDKTVTFQDGSFRSFPELRWAWSNIRQLVPTVNVWRGAGPASVLPRAEHDIGASASVTMDGRPMTFARMLEETYADGIAVLHRGKLIYERYFGALKPHKPHIAMSVTKSFTGTLAGILVAEGKIDPQAPVLEYVPELKASAFRRRAVHEAMDMTTGLEYTEVYTDKNSGVFGLRRERHGADRARLGLSGRDQHFDFLCGQKKQGERQGLRLQDRQFRRCWPLYLPSGERHDAVRSTFRARLVRWARRRTLHYITSTTSAPKAAVAACRPACAISPASAKTIRNHGRFNGRQIVPSAVVEDIARGGDPAKFKPAGYTTLPGASYRNQWWVTHNAHGAYMARGVHGQGIYIDPNAEMVIARYASHPAAGNAANDPVTLPLTWRWRGSDGRGDAASPQPTAASIFATSILPIGIIASNARLATSPPAGHRRSAPARGDLPREAPRPPAAGRSTTPPAADDRVPVTVGLGRVVVAI
jgi:CubicO group peptidase (beta-lactamase class C family)